MIHYIYKSIINYLYPKKPIPKSVRTLTWKNYNGEKTKGLCYACGTPIDIKNWHCSHVVSDKKGGSVTVENLRPCCQHCNLSCGKQNLYTFITNNNLHGPGSKNVFWYLLYNPLQIFSKR